MDQVEARPHQLNKLNNNPVIIKLTSGRAISGTLKSVGTVHTVKLGVKHILVDVKSVKKIVVAPALTSTELSA